MYLYISQSCAAILKEEKKWLRGGVSERCLRLGGRAGGSYIPGSQHEIRYSTTLEGTLMFPPVSMLEVLLRNTSGYLSTLKYWHIILFSHPSLGPVPSGRSVWRNG